MKKFFMVLALASVSVAGMAQDELTEKYSVATNSFWSNWFVQGNVAWNSFYVGGENKFGSTPFYKFGLGADKAAAADKHATALGFSVAVGKWFTPGLGLRTKANFAWLGKAFDKESQTYLALNEQALFNLSNLLCGYNPNRIWNFIPYAGLGVARNFDEKANSFVASAGLLNTFKVSNKVALNLDLGYYSYDKAFVGVESGGIAPKHRFNQLALEAGVTVNLGKGTWNKVPDVEAIKALHQSQLDALNAQLADANAENTRLNNLIKNHKCPEATAAAATVKDVAAAPVSVFFNISKAKVASKKDLVNLKALAEVAKDNDKTLVVTGYADSKTGSASFNQTLSQKRAETVKKELVKLGVAENKIETVAAGGVNDITPVSYNRRAVVTIK